MWISKACSSDVMLLPAMQLGMIISDGQQKKEGYYGGPMSLRREAGVGRWNGRLLFQLL